MSSIGETYPANCHPHLSAVSAVVLIAAELLGGLAIAIGFYARWGQYRAARRS